MRGVFLGEREGRALAACCARAFAADARGGWWTNTQAALALLMEVQAIVFALG
jgi:hypothetical protein